LGKNPDFLLKKLEKSQVDGKNSPAQKVCGFKTPLRGFLLLFLHLAKEESQAIQSAKEEFAIGILWIQGSDLWIWHWNF
jgi:hypothetical protein